MADIEKEKDSQHESEAENADTDAEKSGADQARLQLRELVMTAGDMLSDLDQEPVAVSETSDGPGAPAQVADEAQDTVVEKSKSKKQSRKKKRDPVESVKWEESTADLDFVEPDSGNQSQDANQETVSRFEELARRVAETVAHRSDDESEMLTSFSEEALEGESRGEESTVHSLETSDQENLEASTDLTEGSELSVLSESDEQQPEVELATSNGEQVSLTHFEEVMEAAEDDSADEPKEFIEQDQLVSVIESLLFATDKPVSVATIKTVFKGSNIRTKDITRAIDLLASEYASSTRGVSLEEINGGFQLRTKSDNAEFLRRLAKVRPFRLSGPALEVMAIVAYKQPITKHEIDEIRGVESGHLLRALMERGLISFNGKSDLPGKPMTYGSTRKFLETFGLRNIRELPTLGEIDELLPEGIGEEPEKEKLSDLTDQMSTEVTSSSYSEGEEELQKIADQLKAVDTTSEFFEQEKQRERERRDRERAQDIRERLVMGEAVEDKDKRWLDRYEAKLLEPKETLMAGEEAAPIGGELEKLTEDSASSAQDAAAGGAGATNASGTMDGEEDHIDESELALFEGDDEDSLDELAVNPDWDDDGEKEV